MTEEVEKVWNETMMLLADEDYVLDDLENLKNAIYCFIGRGVEAGKKHAYWEELKFLEKRYGKGLHQLYPDEEIRERIANLKEQIK